MAKTKKPIILRKHPRPYYPYVILGISIIFIFYKLMLLSFPAVISDYLRKDLDLSVEQLRVLSTAGILIMVFVQFPVGFLLDRFSPKKVVSISIFVSSLGALLFANSHSFGMALISRFIVGCGVAAAYINTLKLISNWFFPSRFAILAGCSLAIGLLGGIIGELYFAHFSHVFGWRMTLLYLAIVGLIYALLYLIYVNDSEPGMKYNINPEIKKFSFAKSLKKCIRHPQTWLITVYVGFLGAPVLLFIGIWSVRFFKKQYDLSTIQAVGMQTIFLSSLVIAAPIIGYLSTKQKKRKPYIQITPILLFVIFVISFFVKVNSLIISGVLLSILGLSCGSLPLPYVIIHERNVPKITGSVIGILGTVFTIFGVLEFYLINYIFDHFPSINSYVVIPISIFISFILSFYIRETHAQQRLVEGYRK